MARCEIPASSAPAGKKIDDLARAAFGDVHNAEAIERWFEGVCGSQ